MFRLFRRDRDRGAAMVEFAIILPLFLLLIFGIMESGWFFAQHVEIRNAAREGARLAVVDYGTGADVVAETLRRASLSGATATVTITCDTGPTAAASDDAVTVTVAKTYESLTGAFDFFDGAMSSTAIMRVERSLDQLATDVSGCPVSP